MKASELATKLEMLKDTIEVSFPNDKNGQTYYEFEMHLCGTLNFLQMPAMEYTNPEVFIQLRMLLEKVQGLSAAEPINSIGNFSAKNLDFETYAKHKADLLRMIEDIQTPDEEAKL